jgi:hypothetical protein
LSGDEADLAILNEARPRMAEPLETLPTPTGMRTPASMKPSSETSEHTPIDAAAVPLRPSQSPKAPGDPPTEGAVLSYHVAVVNDGQRVELLWLSPTESAARDLPTAMLVPLDSAAAEAIADMLKRSRQ